MRMKKSIRKPLFLLTFLCVLFFALLFFEEQKNDSDNALADNNSGTLSEEQEYYYNNDVTTNGANMSKIPDTADGFNRTPDIITTIPVDTDTDSMRILVNRKHKLDKDYVPEDLVMPSIRFASYGNLEKNHLRAEAAMWIEKLFEAAASDNVILSGVSGYRSYNRQTQIYNSNILSKGEATTNQVSAKPGTSEHQTGLAMDVSCASVGNDLVQRFGETTEGKWLADNCYKYGFIIRYGKGKEEITGYIYEPWHIRYVGCKLAKYLYKNDLTLEEYYKNTLICDQVADDTGMNKAVRQYLNAKLHPEGQSSTAPASVPASVATRTSSPVQTTSEPEESSAPVKTKKPKETPTPEPTQAPEESPAEVSEPTQAPATAEPAGDDTGISPADAGDAASDTEDGAQ